MLSRIFASLLIAFPLYFTENIHWGLIAMTLAFSLVVFLYTNRIMSLLYFILAISLSLIQLGSVLYSGKLADPYLIISTLATSQEEALSFFDTLSRAQLITTGVYYCGIILALYLLYKHPGPRSTSASLLVAAALLFSVYDLQILPINTLKQIYLGVRSIYEDPAEMHASVIMNRKPLAQTLVLVIGESATKERFSLYGYHKNTNPNLAGRSDLLVYQNVLATGINTQPNVKTILTGQVLPAEVKAETSLIKAAQAAGYRVIYIDNNKFAHPNPLYSLAKHADHYVNINELEQNQDGHFSLDGLITPHYQEALKKNEGPVLIILHMTGSHPAQDIRYPKELDIYDSDYDSTIAYTDLLLNEWIEILEKARPNQSALWMYISDHGVKLPPGCGLGEIPAQERTSYGADDRYYSSMAIPLLVWHSPQFAQAQVLKKNLGAQLDNRLVLPTLLQAMGVDSVNGKSLEGLSLLAFEPDFVPRRTTEGVDLEMAILEHQICTKSNNIDYASH